MSTDPLIIAPTNVLNDLLGRAATDAGVAPVPGPAGIDQGPLVKRARVALASVSNGLDAWRNSGAHNRALAASALGLNLRGVILAGQAAELALAELLPAIVAASPEVPVGDANVPADRPR